VTVPAGVFNALKIEVSGAYVGNSGSISWKGTMEDRIWYAPEVKRPVKTQYQDSASGHGYVRDYQELQSYHVN
jgi:hypothetical protein